MTSLVIFKLMSQKNVISFMVNFFLKVYFVAQTNMYTLNCGIKEVTK